VFAPGLNPSLQAYLPSQSQPYYSPRSQPYGSPQFSSGQQFPEHRDLSDNYPPITPPQFPGYHSPHGQLYSSPQFGHGPQYPRQRGFSDQLVDNSEFGPRRLSRFQRSPSIDSYNSNYSFGSLNTEFHDSELLNDTLHLLFDSSNKRKSTSSGAMSKISSKQAE
jgi:hypothetical protein